MAVVRRVGQGWRLLLEARVLLYAQRRHLHSVCSIVSAVSHTIADRHLRNAYTVKLDTLLAVMSPLEIVVRIDQSRTVWQVPELLER